MDSLINGIIDCVAIPSTTDTPVRVLRKTPSESPTSVSISIRTGDEVEDGPEMLLNDVNSSDSIVSPPSPPQNVRAASPSSLSRNSNSNTPINSVLTAEGILFDINSRSHFPSSCVSCGDCSTIYDPVPLLGCAGEPRDGDNDSDTTVDAAVRSQFEAAFATFLYKNPAFTSMSHITLQKTRQKLLRESAKNMKVETELRQQAKELRESKRQTELELQKELLLITKAKAARESELRNQISKNRAACLQLDSKLQAMIKSQQSSNRSNSGDGLREGGALSTPSPLSTPTSPFLSITTNRTDIVSPIRGSESFEQLRKEQKMEEAHLLAERVRIQRQIAEATVSARKSDTFAQVR